MTSLPNAALPLSGLRVIDFTRVLAGPMCTMLLGDMGAEVIKIEDPAHGDETREWAPFVGGWSTYFLSVNRNKKSVAIDLKSEEGKRLLEDLIGSADVLVENFRPGTLERLGFGPERARSMNERLIYCSISGYGTTGPRRDLPGYDMVIQGESGLMDVTGFPETGPTKVGVAITDCIAALYAVQGILLAHNSRSQTGKGQFLDLALLDSASPCSGCPRASWRPAAAVPAGAATSIPALPRMGRFRRDGQVIVAVANPRLWSRFCAAIGAGHPSTIRALRPTTPAWRTGDRSTTPSARCSRTRIGRAHRAARPRPCGRVRTIDEVLSDTQLAARRMFVDIATSDGPVKMPGNPIRLSDLAALPNTAPPALGQHTREIRDRATKPSSGW
jgi:formyl-CoA transferase